MADKEMSEQNNAEKKIRKGENQEENVSFSEEIKTLQQEITELKHQIKTHQDQYLRAKAEVENIRKRAARELAHAHKYGVERMTKEILDVIDGLDQGLVSANSNPVPNSVVIIEGMKLTYQKMLDVLSKFGISQINPIGESFNPRCHEALTTQSNDGVKSNMILQVVQKGYQIYERVLRPARVIVSK